METREQKVKRGERKKRRKKGKSVREPRLLTHLAFDSGGVHARVWSLSGNALDYWTAGNTWLLAQGKEFPAPSA